MSDALDNLVALLDLETIEVNIFRGHSPAVNAQRVFGGQVAGQALVAAGRTVERGMVHSLHAYFLRPGDPSVPILYEVDRIRDGRSFTTRRVVAIQHGQAIFNLAASFHVAEEGLEHQVDRPDAPDPETLPTFAELLEPWKEQLGAWYEMERPIDTRYIEPGPWMTREGPYPPRQRLWFRADGRLPDDPLVHACVAVYASDMSLLDTVILPHGLKWSDRSLQGASLDHAMWFHRPFRADEWLLYDQDSTNAHGARGLAHGRIFTSGGSLAVSVVQEGLIRVVR